MKPSFITFCIAFCLSWPCFAQQASAPKPDYPQTHLFGVILLQGTNQTQLENQSLPAKTLKVLEEVRDFLPYKNFKMLDSSFIRSDRDASFSLRGPDNRTYSAEMRFSAHPEQEGTLQVHRFQIAELVEEMTGDQKLKYHLNHIETSFSIKIGETIVVGTSRAKGGEEAVIVLFSAG